MEVTPLVFMLIAFIASIAAGLLGSLLGLGGGIIVVPTLTLLLGVDIRYAIGASLVSVIATSSGAGAAYVREHLANIRLAMFLELATTLGALAGAYAAGFAPRQLTFILFGCMMAATALAMVRQKEGHQRKPRPDPVADRLRLHSSYVDKATGRTVTYQVCRSRLGFAISGAAGVISGLLGVGGGIIKVPLMTLAMRMPLKAATATSNFMIGVTAAASAGVYFTRGDINPSIAGPVSLGVLIGATTGSRVLGRIQSRSIKMAFTVVLLITAAQMLWKGIH